MTATVGAMFSAAAAAAGKQFFYTFATGGVREKLVTAWIVCNDDSTNANSSRETIMHEWYHQGITDPYGRRGHACVH